MGLGRIGSKVANFCAAFGAHVIAHDPLVKTTAPGVEWVEAQELLALPQVVLTPHLASRALKSRREMELEAAENLLQGLHDAGAIKNGDGR